MASHLEADYVYLDWAATTPLCEEALEAMRPYLVAGPVCSLVDANANSLHSPGRAAFQALEDARRRIAQAVGAARPSEIVFTGGGTEADNSAIVGIAHAARRDREQKGRVGERMRIVTTRLEHEAVLKSVERLAHEGFEIAYAPCDRRGFVTPASLGRVLDESTVLVSVQAANSEVGCVQPIADLARAAHDAGALFHTDAVQALGKVPIEADAMGIDAATFLAHKICGPKGIGALYLRAHTPFEPYLVGGGQESGRRSGTQNVCGAVGFAAACGAAVESLPEEAARQRTMRDALYVRLSRIPGVKATLDVEQGDESFLPNIVHVLAQGMESETLILRLDALGFGVSGGSACSSRSLEPSHVLSALGIDADRAYGALRVSFGRYTRPEDLERFAEGLERCMA